jgi:hypothetical protein
MELDASKYCSGERAGLDCLPGMEHPAVIHVGRVPRLRGFLKGARTILTSVLVLLANPGPRGLAIFLERDSAGVFPKTGAILRAMGALTQCLLPVVLLLEFQTDGLNEVSLLRLREPD